MGATLEVDDKLHQLLRRVMPLDRFEHDAWYRLLVDSIEDYAIFLIDTTGKEISWNAGAQKVDGYDANEIIGQPISIFFNKMDIISGKPAKLLIEAREYGKVEDERDAKVSIADNGVGIKEEDLSKLFKRFSRIPNKLSNVVGGSGLGLYWANKIIRLHNGHIVVESREGKGSTFNIIVPIGEVGG